MKENVIDVLMYMFENCMEDDSRDDHDQDALRMELQGAGFPSIEIDKAFNWLEGLAAVQDLPAPDPNRCARAIRVYTQDEMEKLNSECRGFLLFLEQAGVLDHLSRELVIDRVMALETEEIDLDQLKWVILLVLFNQPGQEAAFAWMEELVFDRQRDMRH